VKAGGFLASLLVAVAVPAPGCCGDLEWIRRRTAWIRVQDPCSLDVTFRDGEVRDGLACVTGDSPRRSARPPELAG